jgi:hypothetical protein
MNSKYPIYDSSGTLVMLGTGSLSEGKADDTDAWRGGALRLPLGYWPAPEAVMLDQTEELKGKVVGELP